MNKKSNKNYEKNHLNKVGEPTVAYDQEEKLSEEIEYHPVLEKLIQKSIQDAKEGKGISHEEMMQKVKLKYPFLK